MSASKLIQYFSTHATNEKIGQSLSDFQTGIGTVAHVTLDAKQHISHT